LSVILAPEDARLANRNVNSFDKHFQTVMTMPYQVVWEESWKQTTRKCSMCW